MDIRRSVLFLAPKPPPFSGPEVVSKTLAEAKVVKGLIYKYVRSNGGRSNREKGKIRLEMLLSGIKMFWGLLTSCGNRRVRVVYYPVTATQKGWLLKDVWVIALSKALGKRVVIHLHAGHFSLNFEKFSLAAQKIVRFILGKVDMALVLGDGLRREFAGLVAENRIRVLYNPIEVSNNYLPGNSCHDGGVVLFMGHLTKAKGYCDAVRAMELVASQRQSVKFVFAGTLRKGERGVFANQITGEPIEYEDPVELHRNVSGGPFKDNYEYLGMVSGAAKNRLMMDADIFILPSYSEGLSMSMLEAMAMGKPVIVTPVGAHSEIIEDGINGYFVQPGDVVKLADRILALLNSWDLRRRMGEANRTLVKDMFSVDVVADRFASYLKEAVEGNG